MRVKRAGAERTKYPRLREMGGGLLRTRSQTSAAPHHQSRSVLSPPRPGPAPHPTRRAGAARAARRHNAEVTPPGAPHGGPGARPRTAASTERCTFFAPPAAWPRGLARVGASRGVRGGVRGGEGLSREEIVRTATGSRPGSAGTRHALSLRRRERAAAHGRALRPDRRRGGWGGGWRAAGPRRAGFACTRCLRRSSGAHKPAANASAPKPAQRRPQTIRRPRGPRTSPPGR